jgi:NADPH-dependent 2,4-dienoyl-CoA reductase/sulfur reductase-like enzyme
MKMNKTDILILGGGPAGIITAMTAKGYYPEKDITVMKSVDAGVIPCGIPYMFATLDDPDKNALKTTGIESKGIKVIVDEAIDVDKIDRIVKTKSGNEYQYEKLVIATGSKPIVPPIEGIDKIGVYPIKKDLTYLKKMVEKAKAVKNIVVIGGGFIGIEMADEVASLEDKNVAIVEMLSNVLLNAFDDEFCEAAADKLIEKGIKLHLNSKVVEIVGADKATAVKLEDGTELPADMVILGIGAIQNIECIKKCDLRIGRGGGIWVNDYMRTTDRNIFAVGDCAEKRDFFTRDHSPVMLASTATAEARIAGANLYGIKAIRTNPGTIAAFSTYINRLALGSAGLTENTAKDEKFDIVVATSEAPDKHPGAIKGTEKIVVKLIFSKNTKVLLGGQLRGGISVGELINVIAVAIQKRMTANEIAMLQIATHPKLTAAPTIYPIITAAQNIAKL